MYLGSKQVLKLERAGEFVPVAFVETHAFSEDASFIGTTTRLSGGWASSLPTTQSFAVSVNALAARSVYSSGAMVNASIDYLKKLKRGKELTLFRIDTNDGEYIQEFSGYIASIGDTSAAGKFVRFSLQITGEGVPAEIFENASVPGITWDNIVVTWDNEDITFDNEI